MGLRYTSLGSGSEGNALVVETQPHGTRAGTPNGDATRVLLDCGLGLREMTRRLATRGLRPEQINALFITHEHADHLGSALSFSERFNVPIFCSHGTAQAALASNTARQRKIQWKRLCSHASFAIGDLEIHPFPVPHDAAEPTQCVFVHGDTRLGVLTDVGASTPYLVRMLSNCDALVLEANHDADMLADSQYPPSLKKRIGSRHGHLSNHAAAEILAAVNKQRLKHLHAAHLSQQNNQAQLVLDLFSQALQGSAASLGIATQSDGFGWVELRNHLTLS